MTASSRLDLEFHVNIWSDDASIDELAPGLSPEFSLAGDLHKWIEVDGVRFALLASDRSDVWAECPDLVDDDPIASLPTFWPIFAETQTLAHEKAAIAIAALLMQAFMNPMIRAA